MSNYCHYIFKKGKKIGEYCKNPPLFKNLCKQHLRPYYNRWEENKNIDPFFEKAISLNTYFFFKKINEKNNSIELFEKKYLKKKIMKKKISEEKTLVKLDFFENTVYKVSDVLNYYNHSEKVPQIINNSWILSKKIGNGGFGLVYDCYHIKNPKKIYAIKLEHILSSGLYFEIKIYKDMKNSNFIPKLFDCGVYGRIRYIVIEKLYNFNFSIKKLPNLIEGLESFYLNNKSHGDIKLENIMERESGEIVFIDFGLSKSIKKYKDKNTISGTLSYMSINSHMGIVSFKNDLESLMYCILEILNKLPWNTKKLRFDNLNEVLNLKLEFSEKIKKNKFSQEYLDLKKYSRLLLFVKYITNIKNKEIPDYNYLKNLFY